MKYEIERMETIRSIFCLFEKSDQKTEVRLYFSQVVNMSAVFQNADMEVEKMNQYVTGAAIKGLRERNGMTQLQLAERLGVSDKTVSKWETGVSQTKRY